MRILLYYPWIYLKSGIERSIVNIIKHSKHEYTIATHHYDEAGTFPEFKAYPILQLKPVSVRRDLFSVFCSAITIALTRLPVKEYDAVFVQSDGLADLISLRNKRSHLMLMCYTPLRPVFDPYYRAIAYNRTPLCLKPLFLLFSFIFRHADRISWNQFTTVLLISKEIKRRITAGRLVPGRSIIIHPGITIKPLPASATFSPYFLVHGRIMWTKNIELAIRAFMEFKQKYPSSARFSLVIAGMVDRKSQQYLQLLKRIAGKRNFIRFVVNPSDSMLEHLITDCYCGVLSAFNEDWGLSVLECNERAKPVIAVNRGGPLESVIHAKTGLLVEPNVNAFSQAFDRTASHPKLVRNMGKQARIYVKQYDTAAFVDHIDRLFDEIALPNASLKQQKQVF